MCVCACELCTLGAPGEVASVEAESAVLLVTASSAHRVDALGSQLGVGGRSAQLELPLLARLWTLATSGTSFMPCIS